MLPAVHIFRLLRRAIPAFIVIALCTACSTQPHRARQYASYFNELEADDQARLQKGHIGIGDSREMVYIALGTPRRNYRNTFNEEVWEYLGYPEPNEDATVNQRVAYVTVNDFILAKPWDGPRFSTIAVYFEEDHVIHHQTRESSGRGTKPNTIRMVLPKKPPVN